MTSTVTPKSVQSIFEMYSNQMLVVNRRYQRKLVWTLEEKEKFIDSLLQGFPIPLVLTVKQEDSPNLEIIDGLQRLNAIVSFIECEFKVNGEYFDLDSITLTKKFKESNELSQKYPIMKMENYSKILNYEIPFSTTIYKDDEFIDETFRRINTGGRRLSKHDVRQAGTIGVIPDTINTIATYIRRDSSRNSIISLKNMKQISIGDGKLNYGINIYDIFWVKNKIITKENIRCSRDEELISYILTYILSPKRAQTTSSYLDRVYENNSDDCIELTNQINKIGNEEFIKRFNFVFDEILKIFGSGRDNFSNTVCGTNKANLSECFQIIFICLYQLIIEKNKKINNITNLHNDMKNIYLHYKEIFSSKYKWNNDQRTKLIKVTKGIIENNFSDNESKEFEACKWGINLENIINESKTEGKYYDYKSSLVNMDTWKLDEKLINKILKTLTAMTNSEKGECMVIVGIAEDINFVNKHKNLFNKDCVSYSNVYIVGIEDEALKIANSIDNYLKKIHGAIERNENVSEEFKVMVKKNLINFQYNGKEILIFKAERGSIPLTFDDKYYIRESSNNKEVKMGPEIISLMEDFKKI